MKNNTEKSFREYGAIKSALRSYINSAKTSDASGLNTDWLEHTRVVGSIEGQNLNLKRDEVIEVVSTMEKAPEVESRIVWIDYHGNAAAVRMEHLNWSGFRYTDFFVLAKIDGKWKVSGKVFDAHDKR